MKTIITFGTFDVFHIGHLNILQRAKALGDRLIVGISSDQLNLHKKARLPVYQQQERMRIIQELKCVDDVFLEESLELKAQYIRQFNAQTLVMGDDWKGKFDHLSSLCEVVYLSRTPTISTTSIIETIKQQ
ncbi:adenylyltransferase/cytidyltransferase family protein [Enterobacter sp. ECC-175]|uniref:adenylyltransferase/cytidyltransferase family protein n=1 Tax=unclassified Enterobacter TaxID=2608935 RepID=UPI000D432303|nr:adenylyltransferase/cytidyltransferase family protein [Enterobacter sp. RIT 418]RAU33283.1 glycerol-3-phosphate cytidylyltransferase [Enterobacter sp. RIT 418]